MLALPMANFIDWLEKQMYARHLNQSELARLSGIPGPTLNRILTGQRNAGPGVLTKLARGLGMPEDAMFRMAGTLPQATAPASRLRQPTGSAPPPRWPLPPD